MSDSESDPKAPVSLPFATFPPNLYIRVRPDENRGGDSSALFDALTQNPDPDAWAEQSILEPLTHKMRVKFNEADTVRQIEAPSVVASHDLVAIEGTDKPAVFGEDDKPMMFSRVTTPRYTKDLAELRLTPRKIDELIIKSGTDLGQEVTRLFLKSLLDTAKLTELYALEDIYRESAPADSRSKLLIMPHTDTRIMVHPDTLEELNPRPENAVACTDLSLTELFVLPPNIKITYRHLDAPTIWLERTAYMVEFFCYLTVGARISNLKGLRRYVWPEPEETKGDSSCED